MIDNNEYEASLGRRAPMISVVLPVYNGEKYLADSIKSILNQIFTDFELIAINDGSTDGSLDILRYYERQDTRVRLISRGNQNLVATLNESIDLARGNWIARMDQDDISLPFRFDHQLRWLDKSGADMCGSWIQFFGSTDHRVWKCYQSDQAIKADMLFRCPFAHPSVMMRTSLAKRLKYDNAYEKAEDYDLWVRAAQSGWKMSNVPEVLLLYRKHDYQISQVSSAFQVKRGDEIRKRYLSYTAGIFGFQVKEVEEIGNLVNASVDTDLNVVEDVIVKLLEGTAGEARVAILENIARLYSWIPIYSPLVFVKWFKLVKRFDVDITLTSVLMLLVIRCLNLKREGFLFRVVKKNYSRLHGLSS